MKNDSGAVTVDRVVLTAAMSNGSPATEAQIREVLNDLDSAKIRTEYAIGGEVALPETINFKLTDQGIIVPSSASS